MHEIRDEEESFKIKTLLFLIISVFWSVYFEKASALRYVQIDFTIFAHSQRALIQLVFSTSKLNAERLS